MILHQLDGGISGFRISLDQYFKSAAFALADRICRRFDAVFVQNVNYLSRLGFVLHGLNASRAATGEQKQTRQ
jgi:hypothetical protein